MNAVQMAVDKVNSEGGIMGCPIKIYAQDAANSATTGINALNKVLEDDPIAIVGPMLGTMMIPSREIIDMEKVPIISASGTRTWTMNDNKYGFRIGEFDGSSKVALADFVVNELGFKKIGILISADQWGYSGRDYIQLAFKKNFDIDVTDVETTS